MKKQSIPVFGLAYAQGNAFKEEIAKGDNNSFLKARHESKLTSLNVIAKRNQRRVQVMKKQSL